MHSTAVCLAINRLMGFTYIFHCIHIFDVLCTLAITQNIFIFLLIRLIFPYDCEHTIIHIEKYVLISGSTVNNILHIVVTLSHYLINQNFFCTLWRINPDQKLLCYHLQTVIIIYFSLHVSYIPKAVVSLVFVTLSLTSMQNFIHANEF